MKKILVLHGVNLNMFGERDPAQYGTITLAEIDAKKRFEFGFQFFFYRVGQPTAAADISRRSVPTNDGIQAPAPFKKTDE